MALRTRSAKHCHRAADHGFECISRLGGFASYQNRGSMARAAIDTMATISLRSWITYDHGQQSQDQTEQIAIADPELLPSRQRFFMLNLVQPEPFANRLGLGFSQTVRLSSKPLRKASDAIFADSMKRQSERGRDPPAQASGRHRLEHEKRRKWRMRCRVRRKLENSFRKRWP